MSDYASLKKVEPRINTESLKVIEGMYQDGTLANGFENPSLKISNTNTKELLVFMTYDHNPNRIQFLKKIYVPENSTIYEIAIIGNIVRCGPNDYGLYGIIKINDCNQREIEDKETFEWYSTKKNDKPIIMSKADKETIDSVATEVLSRIYPKEDKKTLEEKI